MATIHFKNGKTINVDTPHEEMLRLLNQAFYEGASYILVQSNEHKNLFININEVIYIEEI